MDLENGVDKFRSSDSIRIRVTQVFETTFSWTLKDFEIPQYKWEVGNLVFLILFKFDFFFNFLILVLYKFSRRIYNITVMKFC